MSITLAVQGLAFLGICLATALVVWVSSSRLEIDPIPAIALYLGTSLVYLTALSRYALAPPLSVRALVAFALVFRAIAFFAQPIFTDDLYRYRWEGRLQLNGGNPYQSRPADLQWSQIESSRVSGRAFKAVYGPLALHLEREMARIDDSIAIQKLPAVIADIAMLLLLSRWHGARAALLYGWCPLPIIEFAGMGHNDALLVLGLFLAIRFRSGLALGIAIAVKWWPALFLPAFFRERKGYVAPLVPLLLFLPYLSDMRENADFATGFLGGWSNNPSLFWLIEAISPPGRTAKFVCLALLAGIALVPQRLERSMFTTTLALLLLSANVHPWYLTWLLPYWQMLTVAPIAVWIALTPLQYWGLTSWKTGGPWLERGPWNAIVYGAAALALLIWHFNRRRGTLRPRLH